jgi:hypothetical protein
MKIIITEQQLARLNPQVNIPTPDDYLRSFTNKVSKEIPKQKESFVYQRYKNQDLEYYKKILDGIGAKPTPENLGFLYAWRQCESSLNKPSNYCNNPFHTSWDTDKKGVKFGGPESTMKPRQNNDKVKSYKDINIGLKATISTLLSKTNRYVNVVNAIRNENNKIMDIYNESKGSLPIWGTDVKTLKQVIEGYLKNSSPKPALFSTC